MIKNIVLVAFGGAIGSILRYIIHLIVLKKTSSLFPIQTLVVNVLGSFLIGILIGYFSRNQNESLKVFLVTGFCGGFTTFSAFGLENISLLQNQHYYIAFIYTILTLVLGLAAVSFGLYICR